VDVVGRGTRGGGPRNGGGGGGFGAVDGTSVGALAVAGIRFGIGNFDLAGLGLLLLTAPTTGPSAMLQLNGPVISWTD